MAVRVLFRARKAFEGLSARNAYPRAADDETRRFVAYWFDEYARRQLASLASAIANVKDESTRNVLWCAFSRLIVTKQSGASLAMDLSHSRPHRVFQRAPTKPFRKFLSAVKRVVSNCIDRESEMQGPPPDIYLGDARFLPVADESIDLVLTSPPYLNAIDYMRCSKFSLVWMDCSIAQLRRIRRDSIGTESGKGAPGISHQVSNIIAKLKLRPALRPRQHVVLARYICDVYRSMNEVARTLSPTGQAVYVIGENTVEGTYIQNSVIVTEVARLSGLELAQRRVRMIPPNRRYLPPPKKKANRAALDGRMRREVVLAFKKSQFQPGPSPDQPAPCSNNQ
jgi:hypothetical protein